MLGSPDIYHYYTNFNIKNHPLRYVNTYNEVDYSKDAVTDVITDKYMDYNGNNKYTNSDTYINKYTDELEDSMRVLKDAYYDFKTFCEEKAEELREAINLNADEDTKIAICKTVTDRGEKFSDLATDIQADLVLLDASLSKTEKRRSRLRL